MVAIANTSTATVDRSGLTVAVDDPAPAAESTVTVTVTVTGPTGAPLEGVPVDLWVGIVDDAVGDHPVCYEDPDPDASLGDDGNQTGTTACTIDDEDPVTGPDGTVQVSYAHAAPPAHTGVIAWTGDMGQTFLDSFMSGGLARLAVVEVRWQAPATTALSAYPAGGTNPVFGDEANDRMVIQFDGPVTVAPTASVVIDDDTTAAGDTFTFRCDQDLDADGPDLACTTEDEGQRLVITVLQPVPAIDWSDAPAAVLAVDGITGADGGPPVTGFPLPLGHPV